jgi:ribonuclease VapC
VTAVLDSSALLAALLDEPGSQDVATLMEDAVICSVNMSEVAHGLVRNGNSEVQSRALIAALGVAVVNADAELALDAGFLRTQTDQFGLSLGDRFCFALGRRLAAPVITADRIWQNAAETAGVDVRLIR